MITLIEVTNDSVESDKDSYNEIYKESYDDKKNYYTPRSLVYDFQYIDSFDYYHFLAFPNHLNSKPIGIIEVSYFDVTLYVRLLYVKKFYQNKLIEKQILKSAYKTMLKTLKQSQMTIILEIQSDNTKSKALYQEMGFNPYSELVCLENGFDDENSI